MDDLTWDGCTETRRWRRQRQCSRQGALCLQMEDRQCCYGVVDQGQGKGNGCVHEKEKRWMRMKMRMSFRMDFVCFKNSLRIGLSSIHRDWLARIKKNCCTPSFNGRVIPEMLAKSSPFLENYVPIFVPYWKRFTVYTVVESISIMNNETTYY